MSLFEDINRRALYLAEAARRVLIAEAESRRLGIPGKAAWNGYNSRGQPTVIKNNKVIPVTTTSTINLPIGADVYVDETFTIDYKTNSTPKEEKQESKNRPYVISKPKKSKRPTLPGPIEVDDVRGSTWLVYHEYLKELEWTTAVNAETNPFVDGWSLFLSLAPLLVLGGGVLVGVIWYTLFEYHVKAFNVILDPIVPPSQNPSKPNDIPGTEYTYFMIMQGALDQLSTGNLALGTLDGMFIGINAAIGNTLTFVTTNSNGLAFTEKFFLRPWRLSANDKINALLYHYGPDKVQAGIIRVVGVYPSKKFRINVHSWPVPDAEIVQFDPDWSEEQRAAWTESLPKMRYKEFVIPDDITEWDTILGSGLRDADNDIGDNIPYEVIPAHEFYSFSGGEEPYDITKFASYSENNLFLNYIVKCYAPWTGVSDSLRINYFLLTLRFTNNPENETIDIAYKFNLSNFNIPPEFIVLGSTAVEDPNFPIQGGERNVIERKITYTIKGKNDPVAELTPITIIAVKGDNEKRGFLTASDADAGSTYFLDTDGSVAYDPEYASTFSVTGAPAGFVYNENTGEFIFDQNISPYGDMKTGDTRSFLAEYTVSDKQGGTVSNTINILVQGSESTFVSDDPTTPSAKIISIEGEEDPAPSQPWDPDPIEESEETGVVQVFEKITTDIPFPEFKEDDSPFGWQGRVARVELKEVEPPVIRLKRPSGSTIINNTFVTAEDFIFSVTTDKIPASGGASKFIAEFTPKPKNYDFLSEGSEIYITYTLRGLVNNAPFVGNFEDLNEFQKKTILGYVYGSAFPNDWRSKVCNPRRQQSGPGIILAQGDSPVRDGNIPPINIDIENRTISYDFIHEFSLIDPLVDSPWHAASATNNSPIFLTNGLVYDFNETSCDLLFYAPDDTGKESPLDWESVVSIIQNNGQSVLKTNFFVDAMLPYEIDKSDTTGNKWRFNKDHSKPTKAYMIYGFMAR